MEESKYLKHAILEVVDNQLRDGDPPCAREAYRRLQELGSTKENARKVLAVAVTDTICETMKAREQFDEGRYERRVWDLVDRYERGLPFWDEWPACSLCRYATIPSARKGPDDNRAAYGKDAYGRLRHRR